MTSRRLPRAQRGKSRPETRQRRLCNLVVAAALLVVLAPLMLVLAVAIKLESRGSILYASRRVGRHGRQFDMLKFRKMHRDAVGPPLTAANDDRLTRVGSFLARTKLDELPQLWNVVRGEMALVGPRPEDPSFVAVYPDAYAAVLQVRPGITGLSQLAFANEVAILARPELAGQYVERLMPAKLAIDTFYASRRSFVLDVKILLWTLAAVVLDTNVAVHRETGRLSVRRRSDLPSEAPAEQPA